MRVPRGKKRAGIGWALMVLGTTIVVLGVIWTVLYYGGMTQVSSQITNQYGSSIFDQNSYSFVNTVAAYWLVICTVALLLWLWQQSNKRDLQYA